ncbi:MAG: hypothetical protein AAGE52_15060, partial [Myxococcota bacterium]
GAVVNAARYLYEAREKPFPLDDERAVTVVDDARAQLVLADENYYDAVVSQPSHPWLAGSSALYTQEFFQEVDRALAEGGVLSLWTNLFRIDVPHLKSIVATLLTVFDHVNAFVVEDSSFILLASNSPLPLDTRMGERVALEGMRPYLRPFGLDDLVDYGAGLELDSAGTRLFAEGGALIVDDRPALEFDLARIPHMQDLSRGDLDYALREVPWVTQETFSAVPEEMRTDLLIQRIEYIALRRQALLRVRQSLDALELPALERHLVDGVLAEQLGDVRGALEAYDQAITDDRASYRADILRRDERLHESLLATLDRPRARPTSLRPFLMAVLSLQDRERARQVVAMGPEVNNAADDGLIALTQAWIEEDCETLLAIEDEGAFEYQPAALEAARCAYAGGDRDRGLAYVEQYHRLARAEAAANSREGNEARNAENKGLAMRYFYRALAAYPAHAASAAALSRMLHLLERDEEAAQVLRDCYQATRGLPTSVSTLRGAADELGITL